MLARMAWYGWLVGFTVFTQVCFEVLEYLGRDVEAEQVSQVQFLMLNHRRSDAA